MRYLCLIWMESCTRYQPGQGRGENWVGGGYFQKVFRKNGRFVYKAYTDVIRAVAALPIYNIDQKLVGVIVGMPAGKLKERIKTHRRGETGKAYLLSEESRFYPARRHLHNNSGRSLVDGMGPTGRFPPS